MVGNSLKRARECEPDSELFAYHNVKKLCPPWQNAFPSPIDQTLRFRASALTPVDSSDDDGDNKAGNNSSFSAASTRVHGRRPPTLQLNPSSAARQFPGLAGGDHLSPWLLNAQSTGSAQASPIPHNTFNHSLSLNGAQSTVPTSSYFPASVLTTHQSKNDHNMMEDVSFYKENHPPAFTNRLPSPVSETDASTARGNQAPPEDTEMDYVQTSAEHMITPSTPPQTSSTTQYSQQTFEDLMKQAAASSPNHRKRPALVMGFRSDCEKCRCRVPGHYNHIMRD